MPSRRSFLQILTGGFASALGLRHLPISVASVRVRDSVAKHLLNIYAEPRTWVAGEMITSKDLNTITADVLRDLDVSPDA